MPSMVSITDKQADVTQKANNNEEVEQEYLKNAEKLIKEGKKTYKTIPTQFKQSLFELTGDLDRKEFAELIKPYVAIRKKGQRLIDLKDANNRSLLSQAAFKGNSEVVQYLLAFYKALNTNPYSEDINGNNALELACIRGYNNSHTERYEHSSGSLTNISKRYFVIRHLLEFKMLVSDPGQKSKTSQIFGKP